MYEYKCIVKRIIDGDTVDVDIDLGFGVWLHDERIRLNGLDTPESRSSDPVEKLFGMISKERVKKFFEDEKEVTILSKNFEKGKFGRILADFTVKSEIRTLCAILISEGYAVPYHGQSKTLIADEHLANRSRLLYEGIVTQEAIDIVSKV
jgi:micrococcal nuclease